MSRPFKLYRLQQIDTQIDRATARLVEVQIELTNDATLLRAKRNAEKTIHRYEEKLKAQKLAEDNLDHQSNKIEQTEATLYSGKVSNPKELEDLHNEVNALKRYRIVLEDRLLEKMLEEEQAESEKSDAGRSLQVEQERYEYKQQELINEKEKLEKYIVRYEQERQAAISSIPDDDLVLYNQIREQSHGIAVAKVTDKACSACGTTLNAMLLHAARSPNQINRCDTCARILYLG